MGDGRSLTTDEEATGQFFSALLDDDVEGLYDRAPCGYLSTTPDGTIIKVNGTFLRWTGHRRSDLIGRRRFADLLTAGGRIYHETHYAPLLQIQGTAREIALEVLTADGRRLPVLVNGVLERDAHGNPVVIRTALFDATERRQYERELLRAKEEAEASTERAQVLARALQQTLIPPTPPVIPHLDVAAAYRPAGSGKEVGGDFYDVFEIVPDDWAIAVGDVCGKGVEAAVVTALARHTIRSSAVHHASPSETLGALNEVLLRQETDRFCTVALLRLRRTGAVWRVTIACGGHPLPLLIPADGEPTTVGQPGSIIGALEAVSFHDDVVDLHPGDGLVVYTDGVTEARQGDQFYGEERLSEASSRHVRAASELVEAIVSDVLVFQSDNPCDDIAVVVIQVPDRDRDVIRS